LLNHVDDAFDLEAIAPHPLVAAHQGIPFVLLAFVVYDPVQVATEDDVFVVGHFAQLVFQVKSARAIFPGVEVGQGKVVVNHGVIGYWLLVIGYWLLVIGYWLLVVEGISRRTSLTRAVMSSMLSWSGSGPKASTLAIRASKVEGF
jgi:hypothetical protein